MAPFYPYIYKMIPILFLSDVNGNSYNILYDSGVPPAFKIFISVNCLLTNLNPTSSAKLTKAISSGLLA